LIVFVVLFPLNYFVNLLLHSYLMVVYIFGSGDCGQLGMGEDNVSYDEPVEVTFFNDKHITSVTAGGLHSLALSSNGTVVKTRSPSILFLD
jgi:alpha-tubulin suppressor-like RCC1 family protein